MKQDYNPEKDGVDHINIYSKGKTELGKWLSNFAYSPILIPQHADFKSIEGYWYWLSTGEESLRELTGHKAKIIGKRSPIKFKMTDKEFNDYIRKALDIKLKSNQEKLKLFTDSTLPFKHYYVYGHEDRIVIDAGYKWIIDHFELRRKQMKDYLS